MLCHTCRNRALRVIAGFSIWGCPTKKLRFGITSDWRNGKFMGEARFKKEARVSDMPKECSDYKRVI